MEGYPTGYQVLCMNCQVSRRDNGGVCAHKKEITLSGDELLNEFDKLRVGWGNTEATQCEEYKIASTNLMRKLKLAN